LAALATEPLTPTELSRFRELDSKRLHQFSNADFSEFLSFRRQALGVQEPTQEMAFFAEKALQQPYRLNAMRFDLGESDCMVLVERVLAMALADDWPSYYKLRQRLAHKDGIVSVL